MEHCTGLKNMSHQRAIHHKENDTHINTAQQTENNRRLHRTEQYITVKNNTAQQTENHIN